MALRKHSPTLREAEAAQERAMEEEVEKIKKVLWEIYQSLNRSSDRIDLYIENIDRNLAQIREQKEQLAILERQLGIGQPSV